MAASENNATTLACFYFVILTNQHTFYYANTRQGNTRDSNRFFYVLKPQGNQSWAVFYFYFTKQPLNKFENWNRLVS